ncbi:hypothetical protein EYF80_038116 [Liparis tanakae]|uniref:Uncharacterized protein n=1 Tax=Liparis tanakae TaxID=230148 RepID=A0A4Z2GG38_9TELE|nr:hypothetical protein EYF80_038116 [Liparis tanakae]
MEPLSDPHVHVGKTALARLARPNDCRLGSKREREPEFPPAAFCSTPLNALQHGKLSATVSSIHFPLHPSRLLFLPAALSPIGFRPPLPPPNPTCSHRCVAPIYGFITAAIQGRGKRGEVEEKRDGERHQGKRHGK